MSFFSNSNVWIGTSFCSQKERWATTAVFNVDISTLDQLLNSWFYGWRKALDTNFRNYISANIQNLPASPLLKKAHKYKIDTAEIFIFSSSKLKNYFCIGSTDRSWTWTCHQNNQKSGFLLFLAHDRDKTKIRTRKKQQLSKNPASA